MLLPDSFPPFLGLWGPVQYDRGEDGGWWCCLKPRNKQGAWGAEVRGHRDQAKAEGAGMRGQRKKWGALGGRGEEGAAGMGCRKAVASPAGEEAAVEL